MEFIQTHITFVVATLTLISQIFFVALAILLFLEKKIREYVYGFVDKHVLTLLFVTTLAALIGSLAYSNIVGFLPCELCWIQRIFIYPQSVLTFMAILKKDRNIVSYLLPLSILGALVALYHSLTQLGIGSSLLGCTSVGGECARVYVLEYGYITIPMMALTTFLYLIGISLIYFKAKNVGK
ncbi:disulfide bond formation protein B [Patescibacteria group bacterium]|nr:disulfide bond formation protein B [Patescibacteria group bacterium]